jgi:hypothetical protein
MEAQNNQISVINRFGDCDFVLAVCICFLCHSDRFGVIRNFRLLNITGNRFPVEGSDHRTKATSSFNFWLAV